MILAAAQVAREAGVESLDWQTAIWPTWLMVIMMWRGLKEDNFPDRWLVAS